MTKSIDSGALPLERRLVSLTEVAAEVVDGMQARATAAGIAPLPGRDLLHTSKEGADRFQRDVGSMDHV